MSIMLKIMQIVSKLQRRKEVWKYPKGEKFLVPRNGKKGVKTFLYRPENADKPWPVLFNLHGGAWVGGDASQMDSYCLDMAEKCGAFIVNINYTKIDVRHFPYPQEEIRDTVLYFREHAAAYGINPNRMALIGYSAGGHLAAASTLMLHDLGIDISAQVLCYPFLNYTSLSSLAQDERQEKLFREFFLGKKNKADDPYISPAVVSDENMRGLAPAIIITCKDDPLTPVAEEYHHRLLKNGCKSVYRYYDKALHGFLEGNRMEYQDNPNKTPEAAALARDAEAFIADELGKIWGTNK